MTVLHTNPGDAPPKEAKEDEGVLLAFMRRAHGLTKDDGILDAKERAALHALAPHVDAVPIGEATRSLLTAALGRSERWAYRIAASDSAPMESTHG